MSNYIATVIKTGNSYALRVPKEYIDKSKLSLGQKVQVGEPTLVPIKHDPKAIKQAIKNLQKVGAYKSITTLSLGSERLEKISLFREDTKTIMICFDTNIIIYIGNGRLNEDIIGDDPIYYASVTAIESLGYPDILSAEEQKIKALLETFTEVPLNESIIKKAIQLKQLKRMSLGDAIIAATAIENNCTLWTANIEDFTEIDNLKLFNPLANG